MQISRYTSRSHLLLPFPEIKFPILSFQAIKGCSHLLLPKSERTKSRIVPFFPVRLEEIVPNDVVLLFLHVAHQGPAILIEAGTPEDGYAVNVTISVALKVLDQGIWMDIPVASGKFGFLVASEHLPLESSHHFHERLSVHEDPRACIVREHPQSANDIEGEIRQGHNYIV